jgi:hypothetical protein
MSDWFNELNTHGRNFVAAGRAKNSWEGVYKSIVDKYPDPIHFVYELLQNADDQTASEVSFTLNRDSLVFQHNGNSFTRKDVEHITEIGNSDKLEEGNKIGRYGIGFKSVYSVTECPQVFTFLDDQPFAFQIEDLVTPAKLPINASHPEHGITRFVLPFKQEKAEVTHHQLAHKLRALGADTIMFLNHLRLITWQVENENGTYFCERPESLNGICSLKREVFLYDVLAQQEEIQYLQYSRPVRIEGDRSNLSVSIAFRLDNGQIVEEKERPLNVYFPTSRDTRLKFRLHAPMILTPDRANIRENEPKNIYLISECAVLLAETLPQLRDAGKLTAECLYCLPVRHQDFPESFFFRPLYEAVRSQLRSNEPLLPTMEGSSRTHVTATFGKISESSPVRNLLSEQQLTALHTNPTKSPTCWLAEKFRKVATPDMWNYLQRELGIEEIDTEDFADLLNKIFLQDQTDEWISRFYTMLLKSESLWEKDHHSNPRLLKKEIIRLEDGTHVTPFDAEGRCLAFLPFTTEGHFDFPMVKRTIVQQERALEFLQRLGLEKPDIVDQVTRTVLPKYTSAIPVSYSPSQYAADIGLIGEAAEEAGRMAYSATKRSELEGGLKRAAFVLSTNTSTTKRVFLKPKDVKHPTQELLAWDAGNDDTWFIDDELVTMSGWKATHTFLNRNSRTICDELFIRSSRSRDKNGYVEISTRKPHKRGINGFDPDATIDGLAYAVQNPSLEKARLLWSLLTHNPYCLIGVVETSSDAHYTAPERDNFPSLIYNACHNKEWLPNANGKFYAPNVICLSDLPHDFDKTSQSAKLIAEKLGMKPIKQQSADEKLAEELGIPPSYLTLIKQHREDFKRWAETQQFAVFSAGDSAYQRRLDMLTNMQKDAPELVREPKLRSVRVSSRNIHAQDKLHLRLLYDKEGRMQCQICLGEMPFQINGEDYFEAVQCIKPSKDEDLSNQELLVNRLALCPVCAAKYLYANSYHGNWKALRQAILCLENDKLPIILADRPHTIHFKAKHIDELKTIFRAATLDE